MQGRPPTVASQAKQFKWGVDQRRRQQILLEKQKSARRDLTDHARALAETLDDPVRWRVAAPCRRSSTAERLRVALCQDVVNASSATEETEDADDLMRVEAERPARR